MGQCFCSAIPGRFCSNLLWDLQVRVCAFPLYAPEGISPDLKPTPTRASMRQVWFSVLVAWLRLFPTSCTTCLILKFCVSLRSNISLVSFCRFDCKPYQWPLSHTYCSETLETNAHFVCTSVRSGASTFVLRGFWKCIGFDDSSSTGHWSQRQTRSSMNFLSWDIKTL